MIFGSDLLGYISFNFGAMIRSPTLGCCNYSTGFPLKPGMTRKWSQLSRDDKCEIAVKCEMLPVKW